MYTCVYMYITGASDDNSSSLSNMHICRCMYICMYVYIHVYICISQVPRMTTSAVFAIYVCISICMYVCVCVCVSKICRDNYEAYITPAHIHIHECVVC